MSSHAGIYDIFWYYGTNNTKVKLIQNAYIAESPYPGGCSVLRRFEFL